jgi:hypothetical protein
MRERLVRQVAVSWCELGSRLAIRAFFHGVKAARIAGLGGEGNCVMRLGEIAATARGPKLTPGGGRTIFAPAKTRA